MGIAIVVETSKYICIDGVTYVPLEEGASACTLALGRWHSNYSTAMAGVLEIAREHFPSGTWPRTARSNLATEPN